MWHEQALEQLTLWWDTSFWPRLQGLTDHEYFWEPAAGSWNIRPQPNGVFSMDWAWPTPDPPPVTTIAWRLGHIGSGIFAVRNADHFGGPAWDMLGNDWPGSADHALAWVASGYESWRAGVATLTEENLAKPIGPTGGPWSDAPMAALVLHISREVIHHGAEICLLRDLYRATLQEAPQGQHAVPAEPAGS